MTVFVNYLTPKTIKVAMVTRYNVGKNAGDVFFVIATFDCIVKTFSWPGETIALEYW